jgi:hypothetical protein
MTLQDTPLPARGRSVSLDVGRRALHGLDATAPGLLVACYASASYHLAGRDHMAEQTNEHVTVIFYGDGRDKHGLPEPFHRYEVYTSKWHRDGGLASVLTITPGSPSPNPPHFPTLTGGIEGARNRAKDALRKLQSTLNVNVG